MTLRRDLEIFLLPEAQASLKLVFDNVRNYFICGEILAMAFWFKSGKATVPPFIFKEPPKDGGQALTWVTLGVSLLLFALNAYQSYLIDRRMLQASDGTDSTATNRSSKLPLHLTAILYVLAYAILAIVILAVSMFATFAVYLFWFAATGTRS